MRFNVNKELLEQVRKLKIVSKRLVDSHLAGDYSSAFKGAGFEFDQLREYQFGDDVRSIDWNASAKSGSLMVKEFVPERDRTVILAVDCSESMMYSSQADLKRDFVFYVASVLAFIASCNNDRVGLLLFAEGVKAWMPPEKGRLVVTKVIDKLCDFSRIGGAADIADALSFLSGIRNSNCVLFFISDWITKHDCLRRQLQVVARKHEAVAVRILDKLERDFPDVGMLEVEDIESGRRMMIDTSSKKARDLIAIRVRSQTRMFESCGVDLLDLQVGDKVSRKLAEFFHKRSGRLK